MGNVEKPATNPSDKRAKHKTPADKANNLAKSVYGTPESSNITAKNTVKPAANLADNATGTNSAANSSDNAAGTSSTANPSDTGAGTTAPAAGDTTAGTGSVNTLAKGESAIIQPVVVQPLNLGLTPTDANNSAPVDSNIVPTLTGVSSTGGEILSDSTGSPLSPLNTEVSLTPPANLEQPINLNFNFDAPTGFSTNNLGFGSSVLNGLTYNQSGVDSILAGDISPTQNVVPKSSINMASTCYDSNNNINLVQEPNGNILQFGSYNANGKPTQFTETIKGVSTTYTSTDGGKTYTDANGGAITNLTVASSGEVTYDCVLNGQKVNTDFSTSGQIIVREVTNGTLGKITQMTDGGGNTFKYTYDSSGTLTGIVSGNHIYHSIGNGQFSDQSTTGDQVANPDVIDNIKISSDGTLSFNYLKGPAAGFSKTYAADGSSTLVNKNTGDVVDFNTNNQVTSKTYKKGSQTFTVTAEYNNGNLSKIVSSQYGTRVKTAAGWELTALPPKTSPEYAKLAAELQAAKAKKPPQAVILTNPIQFDSYGNFEEGKKVILTNPAKGPTTALLPNGDEYLYNYAPNMPKTSANLVSVQYIDKDAHDNPTQEYVKNASGQWVESIKNASGQWVAQKTTYTNLTIDLNSKNPTDLPVLTEANGNTTKFIQDPFDPSPLISYTYNKNNQLIGSAVLTGPVQYTATIDNNSGKWLLTSSNPVINNTEVSSIGVVDLSGETTYLNTLGQVVNPSPESVINNPNDSTVARNSNGQITSERFGLNTYNFTYDNSGNLIGISSVSVNPNTAQQVLNSKFLTIDPTNNSDYIINGKEVPKSSFSFNNLTGDGSFSFKDTTGNSFSYESNGQIIEKNSKNQITSMTDQGGNTFTYSYDSSGSLNGFTTPNYPNGVNTFKLTNGNPSQFTDGSISINPNSVHINPSDGTLTYTDTLGNTRTYLSNGTETYSAKDGTTVTFNNLEKPIEIVDSAGDKTSINYNSDGSQITSINSSKFGIWDYNGISWNLKQPGSFIGPLPGGATLQAGSILDGILSFDNNGNFHIVPTASDSTTGKTSLIQNPKTAPLTIPGFTNDQGYTTTLGDGVVATIDISLPGDPIIQAQLPNGGPTFSYAGFNGSGQAQEVTLSGAGTTKLPTNYVLAGISNDGTPILADSKGNKMSFGSSLNGNLYEYRFTSGQLSQVTRVDQTTKSRSIYVNTAKGWVEQGNSSSANNPSQVIPIYTTDGTVNLVNTKGQILIAQKPASSETFASSIFEGKTAITS